jgi:hypothetical protein
MVISLLVIAANPIQLPISIISGKFYAHIHQDLTPSITNKFEPTPVILAPMEFNIYTAAANKVHKQHYKQLFFLC